MEKFEERKIGEVFTLQGKDYIVVEGDGCEDCAFKVKDTDSCSRDYRGTFCHKCERSDGKNVYFEEFSNEVKVKIPDVLAAYKEAKEIGNREVCNTLIKLFGKEMFREKDVTKRIKTFEDACEELGNEHPLVREWSLGDNFSKDLEAYLKLRIICAALNEGWKPQFTDDEYRYFPWFYIYTKQELEEMDEEERNRVVGRAFNNASAIGGLVYASAIYASSDSSTYYGSRLAFKSKELAIYCGQQFFDIWADLIL